MKKYYSYLITFLLLLIFLCKGFNLNAQTIECNYCEGTGKQTKPMLCTNCKDWASDYKRKVPCHVCKDTRRVAPKGTCPICKGKGKVNLGDLTSEIMGTDIPATPNLPKKIKGYYSDIAMKNIADGNNEKAIGNCNNELKFYPNESPVYVIRGLAKFQLYDYIGAKLDADTAIKILPTNADAFMLRAMVKKQFRFDSEACKDYKKAVELGSEAAKQEMNNCTSE